MLTVKRKTHVNLGGAALLLLTLTAFAGAPEGHPDSIENKLRDTLMTILDREGYLVETRSGWNFQRSVSAYLWDHRQWLATTDIPDARQIDTLVCLLVKKDHHELNEYAGGKMFMDWCDSTVKKPSASSGGSISYPPTDFSVP